MFKVSNRKDRIIYLMHLLTGFQFVLEDTQSYFGGYERANAVRKGCSAKLYIINWKAVMMGYFLGKGADLQFESF